VTPIVQRVLQRFAARAIPLDKGQARKLAKKAVQLMPTKLKFRPAEMGDPLNQQRGYQTWLKGFDLGVYTTKDVRGIHVVVNVVLNAKKSPTSWGGPRKYVSGGTIRSLYPQGPKGKAVGYGFKTRMTIHVNPDRSPQELLDNLGNVEKEVYSVTQEVSNMGTYPQGA